MSRRSLACLLILGALLIIVHVVLASRLSTEADTIILYYTPVEAIIYAIAVVVTLRDKGGDLAATRRAVVFILVVAAILRGMIVPIDPVSTDINRYIWDGRVQDAGINPYRYVPSDPALKDLRDDDIYPEINRKTYAPTIYPPLAQIVFYLVTRIDEDITVMKAAMVAFDGVAIWAIFQLMKVRGVPPTRILLYAWHPVPIWAFAGDGHVDAIAVACVCLGLLAADTRRPILAGLALGGATLTKFFPVLIGPALYRRWDWKLPLAGFFTIVILYLPYLGAGKRLFGFLSAYTGEEGFRDGSGVYLWILLKHIWPGLPQAAFAFYMPLFAVLLCAIGFISLFRYRQRPVDLAGALMLATTFTVLMSPHYMWYLAWLVPFLCFYQSWAILWLTCAATFMNNVHWPNLVGGGSLVFLPFFALAACEITVRYLRTKKEFHGNPIAVEAS